MSSKALLLLLDKLDGEERQAAAQLTAARQQLQLLQQQQQTLSQYQRHYSQEFQNRGREGLSAHQYGHFQGFIDKLEVAQRQQLEGLQQARAQVEQSRAGWLQVRSRRQAIARLLEREALRKEQAAARSEQKMLDNMAIYRFHKHRHS
ncbi:flagellar export protein FliJ [Zobellella denitrificans]|jgi:flagellar FliJ protein|uniref:Flagellar FliJ protein n=1 Tax=Zobellella denitrificans TaxID=347534 RepID=A0A231MV55_9GAMM|nr:flagellar export protein FliJ [Zobellella denitrificans]ATG73199.1 flagellar protein FliJ [Zobellella denitrificans]OXS14038.1 flagellar export protein FliJ [Zobellella denitrificans]